GATTARPLKPSTTAPQTGCSRYRSASLRRSTTAHSRTLQRNANSASGNGVNPRGNPTPHLDLYWCRARLSNYPGVSIGGGSRFPQNQVIARHVSTLRG